MGHRLFGALAAVGGVLLACGAVLDWSGVEYSSGVDRALAFAAGVVSLGLAGVAAAWRSRLLGLAVIPGVVGLNMAAVNVKDIAGHDYEYSVYPEASVGVGLYAVLSGGALVLAAGMGALVPRRWLGGADPS